MSTPERPSRQAVNKIFGDPLPTTSKDERDDAPSGDEADRDSWLRDNVPPHHG